MNVSKLSGAGFKKDDCTYTANYCEENIWHLCKIFIEENRTDGFCLFISNEHRKVALFKQKLSKSESEPVIWDYHVIFICKEVDGYVVYDFDSTLPFPVDYRIYIDNTFKPNRTPQLYHPKFRVVTAKFYYEHFSSDRRHMRIGESWTSPPPKYPPIKSTKSEDAHNLSEFMDITTGSGKYGDTILSIRDLDDKFS